MKTKFYSELNGKVEKAHNRSLLCTVLAFAAMAGITYLLLLLNQVCQ
jgi:hypothetical protein